MSMDTMTPAELEEWARFGLATAQYQQAQKAEAERAEAAKRAEAERAEAERQRLAEIKAKRFHALRVWSGKRAAEKRWGKERERVRRVKVFASDADTLARLARAKGCTVPDVVGLLLAAPPSGAR